MNQEDTANMIMSVIAALNEVLEPIGVNFQYHEETMGLAVMVKEGSSPDWLEAVNRIVMMNATLYSTAFEITSYTTKDKPLVERHQELHRVFMSMGDMLGSSFELATSEASGDIEIAQGLPTKH